MTTVEMIEVMQAWVAGATVQYKSSFSAWIDFDGDGQPSWNWQEITWRIKPAERKPREWWLIPTRADSCDCIETKPFKAQCEVVHVREVLPE